MKTKKKAAKNAKKSPSLIRRLSMKLNVDEHSDRVGTIIRACAKLDAISEALAVLMKDRRDEEFIAERKAYDRGRRDGNDEAQNSREHDMGR